MSYADKNPSSGYGASMGNPNGGVGGSAGGGSMGGPGGGSRYGFRRTPTGLGNWNTGGALAGFGSLGGGINGVQGRQPVGIPSPVGSPIAPMVQPPLPQLAPPQIPIPRPNPWEKNFGTAIDYFDAQNPFGLNPSTFPARPGVSPMAPGVNSRGFSSPTRNMGSGFSGGGRGGGGGGGW